MENLILGGKESSSYFTYLISLPPLVSFATKMRASALAREKERGVWKIATNATLEKWVNLNLG